MVFLNNCGLGIDASKLQSQKPPGGLEFKSKEITPLDPITISS